MTFWSRSIFGASLPASTRSASTWVWWQTSNSPPNCGYSLRKVLKQCGQLVMTLLHALVVEALDRRLDLHLRQVLVAQAAGRVAAAGLLLAQAAPADAGLGQQARDGARDRHVALDQGAGAADPVEVLLAAVELRHVQALHPAGARQGGAAPGVAALLELRQHRLRGRRHVALGQHLVAAHVLQLADVLDHHRALRLAGAAGDAVPDRVDARRRRRRSGARPSSGSTLPLASGVDDLQARPRPGRA